MSKKTRMSFDVLPFERREFENLTEKAGDASMTHTLRRSLALYRSVIELHKQGGKVIFEDKDGKQEVLKFL